MITPTAQTAGRKEGREHTAAFLSPRQAAGEIFIGSRSFIVPAGLRRLFSVTLGIAWIAVAPAREARGQGYWVIDLGPPGGESAAYGINASGQVVGYSRPSIFVGRHAFVYSAGTTTDLGTLGGPNSQASGINSSGQVVGQSAIASGPNHAFLYSSGAMTDLGTLGGTASRGNGINASGHAVGGADVRIEVIPGVFLDYTHAFLYRDGVMTDLGTLGGPTSEAYGINSTGQVVGDARNTLFQPRAFLYRNGTMTNLGTLGGFYSVARGINDLGQIVGSSVITGDNGIHAFLYDSGTMVDLGPLPGGSNSDANAINNLGQVVGSSATCGTGCRRAFLYSGGTMINLQSFLPPNSGWLALSEATSINDTGQIVGVGITSDGFQHGFLMSPNSPPSATSFYTVTPCRVLDTRNPDGPLGGPALVAGADRVFPIAGNCAIPSTAKALSINITITQSTALGDLRLYPGGNPLPSTSTINYRPGQTRANNAILPLGPAGDLTVHCDQASGTVHFILDVNGYFQ